MSSPASASGDGDAAGPHLCHTCLEPIVTPQFIRVGAYKFHKDHFTCSVCQTSLHGKKFHHKDQKFYCANDYVDKFCHICRHCHQKISTGSVIQAFGGYYHPEHFVCKTCNQPFKNGKYYESNDEPYCIAEGTEILTPSGQTVRIEDTAHLPLLLACDATSSSPSTPTSLVASLPSVHVCRGVKDCVELAFNDGRTLICTPDHRILTSEREWMKAADLILGKSKVWATATPTRSIEMEKDEGQDSSSFTLPLPTPLPPLSMDSPAAQARSLAFARILGYCLPSITAADSELELQFDHDADAQAMQYDMQLVMGERNGAISSKSTITLSQPLLSIIASFSDPTSSHSIPSFLLTPSCPLSLLHEYVGAWLGRHLDTPALSPCGTFFTPLTLSSHTSSSVIQHPDMVSIMQRAAGKQQHDGIDLLATVATSVGVRYAAAKQQRIALMQAFNRQRQVDESMTASAFLADAAATHLFEPSAVAPLSPSPCPSPSSSPSSLSPLSAYHVRLISRRSVGEHRVYDLSVPIHSSFIASGLVVHNCDEHYFQLTAEKCASCGQGVKDVDMVRVQSKIFHSHCLSCSHCGLALAKKGSIFQKDGQVYCRNDYLNFFCKRCTACADHILRHCISVNDEYYHPDCLVCSVCRNKLDKYICICGYLRCPDHTEVAVDPPNCSVCNKKIEGEVTLSVGKKLHPECFKCHFCKKDLDKANAKLKDDQLCCAACIYKKDPSLMAKNAAAAAAAASTGDEDTVPEDVAPKAMVVASPKEPTRRPHGRKVSRAVPAGKIEWKKGELIGKGSFGKVYMAMNCFPADDHEVLTGEGFMGYDEFRRRVEGGERIAVACPRLDGTLEFHSVGADALLHAKGVFEHVEMRSPDTEVKESGGYEAERSQHQHIDLAPTTNHNMLVKLTGHGHLAHGRAHDKWQMVTAGEMVTRRQFRDAEPWAQFRTSCSEGVVRAPPSRTQLPFAQALGLQSSDEMDAFLELYGYWLGAGFLSITHEAVAFSPAKQQDVTYLESLFARLPLHSLPTHSGKGGLGYHRAANIDVQGRRNCHFYITHPVWWKHFVDQYGHTYKDGAQYQSMGTKSAECFWWWVLQRLDKRQMRLVLAGLRLADGNEHESRKCKSEQGGQIGTSSVRFRDSVQLLAIMAGYSTHIVASTDTDHWFVQYTSDARRTLPKLSVRQHMRTVTREGSIWCVTVPTADHLIMVRRVMRKDGAIIEASRPVVVGNSATGELIAVKQVRLNTVEEQEQAAAIQNEIGLMENLRHPNIVSLLGTQRNGNKLHILMEYVPGKCWAPGTELLMYDGSCKPVEIIKPGDMLMGDDCKPRRVLPGTLVHGENEMFEIVSEDASRESWRCNDQHILILKTRGEAWMEQHHGNWHVCQWALRTVSEESTLPIKQTLSVHTTRQQAEEAMSMLPSSSPLVFECSVEEYLKLSPACQRACMMFQPDLIHFPTPTVTLQQRLMEAGVMEVDESTVARTAWLVGLWLACGGERTSIRHTNPHVLATIRAWQRSVGEEVMQQRSDGRVELGPTFQTLLASYGMMRSASIPHQLLTECVEVRRALLSGMIDACGECENGDYTVSLDDDALLADIIRLARSLGCKLGKIQNEQQSCRVMLTPTHSTQLNPSIPSNRITIQPSNDVLSSHFRIHPVGVGEYYGFAVDGNGRLLLSDYTITHNSLDSLLEKFGGFSEKVIRSYTKQLLEALQYCHANGVVHRDIKGKNVLIDTKGNLKLADFGSAKRFENVMSKDAPSLSYNYTPLWTAPEVLVGDYNSKVDIWSLGCVIIEMASARPPWSEQNFENPFRALYHIGNSDAIPKIPDTISPVGVAFIMKCLRRNPDERPDASMLLKEEWLKGIESVPQDDDESGSEQEEGEGEGDENGRSGSDSD